MSRSSRQRQTNPPTAPAVCRAGLFQFAAQQTFANGCVQSRGLFWCKSGHGEFAVDGVSYRLQPHDLYVLPWGRQIAYRPSANEPMFTSHVHIVPWYRPGARWVPNVPHEHGEPECDSPDRDDAAWPGLRGVKRMRVEADEPLGRLMDYAVRWYLRSPREEAEARSLGLLLTRELARAAGGAEVAATNLPEELERLLVHVERGFHLGPRIEEMAALVGRSRSYVLKLFRRHLGISAKRHVIYRQLREARELLLSTTLPIAKVGEAVGLADPYHFSKFFRRHVGLSPREYRGQHGPLLHQSLRATAWNRPVRNRTGQKTRKQRSEAHGRAERCLVLTPGSSQIRHRRGVTAPAHADFMHGGHRPPAVSHTGTILSAMTSE